MPDAGLLRLDEVRAAHDRIRALVVRTPLVPLDGGSVDGGSVDGGSVDGGSVLLKAESEQPVGSFKLRGALNTMLGLDADERARGVVAHSSGNHAIAVAHAGAVLDVRVTVVMPVDAPAIKRARTEALGARVVVVGPGSDERVRRAAELEREEGLVPVVPYDSRAILAATATIAVEILEDLGSTVPPVLYVPVSGGGLAGGVAAGAKLLDPRVRVVAVEPEVAADYAASRAAGVRLALPAEQMALTAADGLRVQQVGEVPWPHLQAFVDDAVTVSEAAIAETAEVIRARTGLVAEPSGAVSVVAARESLSSRRGATRVAILTGSNVDPPPQQ